MGQRDSTQAHERVRRLVSRRQSLVNLQAHMGLSLVTVVLKYSVPLGPSWDQNPRFLAAFSEVSGVRTTESSGSMERSETILELLAQSTSQAGRQALIIPAGLASNPSNHFVVLRDSRCRYVGTGKIRCNGSRLRIRKW
jgi:hypothetical protein